MSDSAENGGFWSDPERTMSVITAGNIALFGLLYVANPQIRPLVFALGAFDTAANVIIWRKARQSNDQIPIAEFVIEEQES